MPSQCVVLSQHNGVIWLAMNQRAPGYVIFASPRGLPFDPLLIRQMAPQSIYSPDTAGLAFDPMALAIASSVFDVAAPAHPIA